MTVSADQNEHVTKTTHARSNSGGCHATNKLRIDLTPDSTDSTNRTDSGEYLISDERKGEAIS